MSSVPTEAPTVHEQLSDAFVTLDSLPADEADFASDTYQWDRESSPEEIEADAARCDAAYDATAAAELVARYPGMAKLTDEQLIEIAAEPSATGLMADSGEVQAVAVVLLARRLDERAAAV